MATAPILELDMPPTAGTDIVAVVTQNPGIVLLDREKYSVWYESLKAKGEAIPSDVSTKKNRDALRSFAAEVRSEKAGIKKARLRLTEEWRTMTAQANAAGKEIDEQLESLAVEVRKPLTEWEEAEEDRNDRADAIINQLARDAMVSLDDTAADVRARGMAVYETTLDPALFGDKLDTAQKAKDHAIGTLKAALARLTREEDERAELEALRAEKVKAEADALAEKQEREAKEAAEAKRLADEQRKADEAAAEQKRIDDAKAEAAAAVQREADEKAALIERKRAYARQIIAHIQEVGLGMIGGQSYPYGILLHELTDKIKINEDLGDMQVEVAAIRDATLANIEAAMERQAERDKESAEREKQREYECAKQAELEAEALEAEQRRLNKEHRTAVKAAAKTAIMSCGADEDTARKIVMAIIAGEVPAVSLEF